MVWIALEIVVGGVRYRGRYRVEGGQVHLEWRGGRCVDDPGYVKPELVALGRLRDEARRHQRAIQRQNDKAEAAEARRRRQG